MHKLYIFVEGDDDMRFFLNVIVPLYSKKYDDIEIIKFAQLKKAKIDLFIKSIQTLKFDYIFAADLDAYHGPGQKKKHLTAVFNSLDDERIIIVIMEIESWYLAGLPDYLYKTFKIRHVEDTNDLTKEDFNTLLRGKYHSRIDLMTELLKQYSIETAKAKNISFRFFIENFVY